MCGLTRMIQQAFIDMENMFDLMNEHQEVGYVFLLIIQCLFSYYWLECIKCVAEVWIANYC